MSELVTIKLIVPLLDTEDETDWIFNQLELKNKSIPEVLYSSWI